MAIVPTKIEGPDTTENLVPALVTGYSTQDTNHLFVLTVSSADSQKQNSDCKFAFLVHWLDFD